MRSTPCWVRPSHRHRRRFVSRSSRRDRPRWCDDARARRRHRRHCSRSAVVGVEPIVVEATVVGQTIIHDGSSAEAGDGGLVAASWARELVPGAFAQTFAVRMAPGATLADLDADYAGVSPTMPQNGLANLRRIDSLPWLLAAAVAALAVGAMVHTRRVGSATRRRNWQRCAHRIHATPAAQQRALERDLRRRLRRSARHPTRGDRRAVGLADARHVRRRGDRGATPRGARRGDGGRPHRPRRGLGDRSRRPPAVRIRGVPRPRHTARLLPSR